LGHQARRWNPKMAEYLYGVREGIHIFDLTKTKEKLEETLEFLKKSSKEGKSILFLGTKKQVKELVKKAAEGSGSFYINERWLGGTLTNFEQIRKSTRKLADLKKGLASGEFINYTKKERLLLEREVLRLERFFGGIALLEKAPDVLVIVDIKRENGALLEALDTKTTTVALTDSNTDPNRVDYAVPMNDDGSPALEYVLMLMRDAINEGKNGKSATKDEPENKKSNIKNKKDN
jgi:small subunit ribosomal protein S2